MTVSSLKLTLPTPAIILGLFVCIYIIQVQYDAARYTHLHQASLSYNEVIEPTVASPAIVKAASFGQYAAFSDILWLKTIQYYGGGDPDGKYRQLPKLMQTILSLDPRFEYPYQFSGLVLPAEGFSDAALTILHDGEKSVPNNWLLPYYQGSIYYINKKDYPKAAESYARAATKPNAPATAQFLSAVQYDRSNDYATAYTIFKQVAESSDNAYFKERAQVFMAHYALLHDLELFTKAFHDKEGRYPKDLQELVTRHYIQAVPEDPLKRALEYDAKTGSVSSVLSK